MAEENNLLGRQYRDMYRGYYSNPHGTWKKRRISAAQTVACMTRVLGSGVFKKLLDVGAGDGSVLLELDAKQVASELYGVEISESGVDAIKSRQLRLLQDVQVFDGYRIPYTDKHFDLAIAIHVLEHVEHERLFLQEMRRVSRHAYIEVPLEHGFKLARAIDAGKKFGHINFYTKQTLRSLLESSGMEVLACGVFASSREYDQYLSGRTKGRMKNLIRKTALAMAPDLAPWFIVYNGYALCVCD